MIWCLQFHYRVLLFNRCFQLEMMFEVRAFSFGCAHVPRWVVEVIIFDFSLVVTFIKRLLPDIFCGLNNLMFVSKRKCHELFLSMVHNKSLIQCLRNINSGKIFYLVSFAFQCTFVTFFLKNSWTSNSTDQQKQFKQLHLIKS